MENLLKDYLTQANKKNGTKNKIIQVEVNDGRLVDGFMIKNGIIFYCDMSECMCIQDVDGDIRELSIYEL